MDKIEIDTEKYNLKNLLDPKHPLLEKFRDKAPGSYSHSQNVSALCEAVALKMDLNSDIMRIIGIYHDVGKMTFPDAFYENQNGHGNMHDDLDPIISFHLISKHVSDTALILSQLEDFPKELIKPIVQHHGNSVIKSLSLKAEDIDENMFRYKNTDPPQTLESAILMICDCVQATTRSKEYSKEINDIKDINNIVNSTIRRLEQDDQLDEIRVGDLKNIRKALQNELKSKYHKRESKDYEEKEEEKKE